MSNIDKIRQEIERRKENIVSKVHHYPIHRIELLDDLLTFIDSLPEEKPSEDLEEAADDHIRKVADAAGHPGWDWETQDIAEAFIAGAEWIAEQLKK